MNITDSDRMAWIEENAMILEATSFAKNLPRVTRISATIFLPAAPSVRQAIDAAISLEREGGK